MSIRFICIIAALFASLVIARQAAAAEEVKKYPGGLVPGHPYAPLN
jgi:hypothetical protein